MLFHCLPYKRNIHAGELEIHRHRLIDAIWFPAGLNRNTCKLEKDCISCGINEDIGFYPDHLAHRCNSNRFSFSILHLCRDYLRMIKKFSTAFDGHQLKLTLHALGIKRCYGICITSTVDSMPRRKLLCLETLYKLITKTFYNLLVTSMECHHWTCSAGREATSEEACLLDYKHLCTMA